jgi:hypothetical protein
MDTAASGVGRVEDEGFLIEGPKQNQLLWSSSFDNAAWTKSNTTVSADNVISPDGSQNADRIIETTGSGTHYVYQDSSVISGTMYAQTFFAKTGERSFLQLAGSGGFDGTNTWVNFDLDNGVIGNKGTGTFTYGIQAIGNDWYRLRISAAATSTTSNGRFIAFLLTSDYNGRGESYAGDAAKGAYLFGGKLSAIIPFADSYTPTTTGMITRNADVLSIQTSGNIDNAAGSLAMEWSPIFASTMTTGAAYYLFDAGGAEAYYNATDQKIYLTDGTNTISTAALTFEANVAQKVAFRWGPSGLAIYLAGAEAASGEDFDAFAVNENLYIGSNTAGANQAFANFKHVKAWAKEQNNSSMGMLSQ